MAVVTTDRPTDDVYRITLNRPHRLNAMNHELVSQLHDVLDSVTSDRSVRTVVLTGSGRAFCAGLDLGGYGDDELVERDGTMLRTFERQREIAALVTKIRRLPQPVIAAVNGAAAGGGLALVCASDIRVASTEAKFAVSFIRAGYSSCDIGISWSFPRLVGVGRAHELMLTGRTFDAHEAHRYGLVLDVVEPQSLLDSALEIAARIRDNPPVSVTLTKVGMWTALETPAHETSIEFENRQQMVTAFTDDAAEATSAFLEKRPPQFRYR